MGIRFPFSFPVGNATAPITHPAFPPDALIAKVTGPTGFGQDLDFLSSMDPNFGLVGGNDNLGQALLHRLQTPSGGLFYDPNYGKDLRAYCNDSMTSTKAAQVAADTQTECLKDERVLSCTARATFDQASKIMTVSIFMQTAAGPYSLVVSVSSVSVTLLAPRPQA